jgi:DNA-binding NarL/FixJ family response regulator|tara:strand:+ start:4162 stop:4818 length:657 start_codon:yes stop_codon:yes gene_type:complete
MSWPISILLVDDHTLVREAVRARLQNEKGITVVGSVGSADEAVVEAKRLKPDVLLLDIDMPGKLSFEAAREIKIVSPRMRIIYLSAFFHDRYIQDALSAFAVGYVTKDEPAEILVKAIRLAASGISYFSPKVQDRIVVTDTGVTLLEQSSSLISLLSKRETEALRYIARGLIRTEIASLMKISIKTLDNHTTHIKKKLQLQDRVELTRFAIREGLVDA